MKIIEMEDMNDHFDFDFADAVVVRESVGDIKIGQVKVGKENEADVTAECTADGKLTLDFTIPKCRDGATFTPSVTKDGVLSWTNDKSLINPAPVSLGVSETHSSGSMAFEIKAVNGSVLTLSGVSGIEVGYTYSMQIGNNYNAWGKITAISGNTVTVSDMPTDYVWGTDAVRFISFPEHPELGTFKIGEGAHTFGIDNKANMMGAFATGQENISDGKRSFTAGKGNFAGYHDAAFGQNNNVNGFNNLVSGDGNKTHKNAHNTAVSGYMNNSDADNVAVSGEHNWGNGKNSLVSGSENNTYGKDSYAGGNKCQASKSRSFAHGKGLYAQKEAQAVFGTYNALSTDDLFQVGMGTADNARKNAFVIRNDGRAAVAAQPQTDNDVATKKYVDAHSRGFGLGASAKRVTAGTNLNDVYGSGFYYWGNSTENPDAPFPWGYMLHIQSNSVDNSAQIAFSMLDKGVKKFRCKTNGIWGAWSEDFSGNYDDLTNKPDILTEENVEEIAGNAINTYNQSGGAVTYTSQSMPDGAKATARANIGAGTSNFSGNYNDLTNKPIILTEEDVSSAVDSYNRSGGAVTYTSQSMPDGAKATARANIGAGTSNFSGNYNDLTNKPTILTEEDVSSAVDSYNRSGGAVTYTSQSMNDNAKATARANIGALGATTEVYYNEGGLLTGKSTSFTLADYSWLCFAYIGDNGIDTKFFPRTLISKQSTYTIAFTTSNGIYQIKSTGVTATQANAETKGTLLGIYGIKN